MFINTRKLLTLLPYSGAFLIFWGMLKLTIYFKAFNISINDFLEFSEILTSFFDDLLFYSGSLILGIFLNYLTITKSEIDENDKLKIKIYKEKSIFRRFWLNVKSIFPLLLPFNIFAIVFMIIIYFIKNESIIPIIWYFIGFNSLLIILFIFFEYKRHYYLLTGIHIDYTYFNIILYSSIFTILLIFYTKAEVAQVKYYHKYENVSFFHDNKEIKSNRIKYYIGKTKNYLFFYDSKAKTTYVFSMQHIDKMSFK